METHTDISSIDTGADTEAARAYRKRQEQLQHLVTHGPTRTNTTDVHTDTTVSPNQEDLPKQSDSPYTMTFAPTKSTIELSFTSSAPNATFALQLQPLTLTETDDSISIMIPSTLVIKPPKLTPFTLKVDGRPYTVVFAGGVLKTDKASVISFLRISNNGEASNS